MSSVVAAEANPKNSLWNTTIGSLCDRFGGDVQTGPFGSQLHAADYCQDGIPVVMPQDMRDGRIVCERAARVSLRHVERLKRHVLRAGDVVYSRRGDVSRFAIVTAAEDGWLCGTGSIRIRLNCPDVDIEYVRRYLQQSIVGDWLQRHAKGLTMPNLNTEIVRAIPFLCPALTEQRRIAEILDRAEALRAKRRAALAQLDSLTQSFFLDTFGDPVLNTKRWPIKRLGDVGTLDRGISKHRPRNASELLGGQHPLVQTGDVANCDGYIRAYVSTYSDLGLRQSKLWPKGTLCITIAANIAKTGILTFDACFPDSVVGFRAGDQSTVEYVRIWLSFLQVALEERAPESAQKNINLALLRGLDIPFPPSALRTEFSLQVAAIEKLRSSYRASLGELDILFMSLQARAFRGGL